jgi:hypothetical protein
VRAIPVLGDTVLLRVLCFAIIEESTRNSAAATASSRIEKDEQESVRNCRHTLSAYVCGVFPQQNGSPENILIDGWAARPAF